jgi:hypothetical protein
MTRLLTCLLALAIPLSAAALGATACGRPSGATVVKRFDAPEANQAVAVDSAHFYAIGNSAIGKYEKATGRRVAGWKDDTGHISHLNSGIVVDGELYCAHSNYPETPMVSSLEVFETAGMKHVRSIPLPPGIGSATWVDRADGAWWVAFANYAGKGGEAGRGPERTTLVRFDARWQRQQSWTFPPAVVTKWEGMSSSGGAWVHGRALYTTGHDARELYVLSLPPSGSELVLREIVPFESNGQGIAIDSSDGLLYSIQRRTHEVLVSRLPEGSANH